jgi:hypothetical protein
MWVMQQVFELQAAVMGNARGSSVETEQQW